VKSKDFDIRSRQDMSPHASSLVRAAFCSLGAVCAAGVLAIILFACHSTDWNAFSAILGSGIGIAAASMVIGCLAGFLFGLPRTLSSEEAPLAQSRWARYRPNTNLEQISDWLTKILVGVGLTQLSNIPGKLWGLSAALSPALGGSPSSSPFALILIGFFLIAGFLAGYLWTRIYLWRVLIFSEREDLATQADLAVTLVENAAFSAAIALAGSALSVPDNEPRKAGMLHDAARALGRFSEYSYIRTVAVFLGRLHRQMGDFDTAIDVLTTSLAERRKRSVPEDYDDADMMYNRACYLNVKARKMDENEAQLLRQAALDALRQAFRIRRKHGGHDKYDEDFREFVRFSAKDGDLKDLRDQILKDQELSGFLADFPDKAGPYTGPQSPA
jgi:tetratricopeptide (TPR) repeat protein